MENDQPENLNLLLEDLVGLLTLAGENPFKIRAIQKGADLLREKKEEEIKVLTDLGKLTSLPGIGKGIEAVVKEYFQSGDSQERIELLKKIPEGAFLFSKVSGLGPKKAVQIAEELKIKSLRELQYACKENRLLHLKGFGEKVQKKVLQSVELMLQSEGKKTLDEAVEVVEQIKKEMRDLEDGGQTYRKCEIVSEITFFSNDLEKKAKTLSVELSKKHKISVKVYPKSLSFEERFQLNSSKKHFDSIQKKIDLSKLQNEEEVYRSLGSDFYPPEAREGEWGKKKLDLLSEKDIQGTFHHHSTYSDGENTLEEMVKEASRLGLSYFGISEHSQTAFYARGLKEDKILEQKEEIEKIQKKYPKTKIFFGIESDILKDGSLDYPKKVLEKFDFVIASIHQRFSLTKKEMTKRLLTAIENPYTTMIGHLSGRILLGRDPFEFKEKEVFKACAKNKVIIEMNSNPKRMDVDWRFLGELENLGVMISVNPDAHEVGGISDYKYGVWMARKAHFNKNLVFNSKKTGEIQSWFDSKKSLR